MAYLRAPVKECFDNANLFFLHEEETKRILTQNRDHYYDTFSALDKKARNIRDIEEYTGRIEKSASYFTYAEKERVMQCMEPIFTFFVTLKYPWLDGEKLNRIPWKIAIFSGYDYEHGLPHTREDVILFCRERFASYNTDTLIRTLIHEKIHIYQKLYPDDTERFKEEYGYEKVNRRVDNPTIRSNPDLDAYVYRDKDKQIQACYYHPTASSVEDVYYSPENDQKSEHPHEYMAIFVEDLFPK
jgi:hypothetical protein